MLLTGAWERAGLDPLGSVHRVREIAIWSFQPARELDGCSTRTCSADDSEADGESSMCRRAFAASR